MGKKKVNKKANEESLLKYFPYENTVTITEWLGFDGTKFNNKNDAAEYNRQELIKQFIIEGLGKSTYDVLAPNQLDLINVIASTCCSNVRIDVLMGRLHINNLFPEGWDN